MSAVKPDRGRRMAKGALVALVLGVLLGSLIGASTGVGRAAAQATPSGEETTTADDRPHRPVVRARRLDRVRERCIRRATFAVAGARLDAALTELVDDGTLSQAEADAVAAKLAEGQDGETSAGESAAAATTDADASDAASDAASDVRQRGPCERLAQAAGPGGLVSAAADIVGLPVADVAARLAAGESLAEIAAGEGVSRDDLIAALEATIDERLDAAVAAGRLTETERAERAGARRERLEAFVDHRRGDQAD